MRRSTEAEEGATIGMLTLGVAEDHLSKATTLGTSMAFRRASLLDFKRESLDTHTQTLATLEDNARVAEVAL